MAIAVVTDSTSDIEPERARTLGIDVVPLFVVWGEKSYRDYVDLSRSEFYRKLLNEPVLPTTSQPTAQMFEDAFRPHVEAGDTIVCIVISAKLSGTINAARSAAQQFPGAKIFIVDSESVAGGLGMLAMRAREMAAAGASAEAILETIERQKTRDIVGGVAGLLALRSLPPGGADTEILDAAARTRSAQVFFAGKDATVGGTTVLRGKPAASSSGVLYAGGSLSEAAAAALQAMGARDGGLITVYYGGAQKERDAQRLSDDLRAVFPQADVEYYYGGQKNAEFWVSWDE